MSVKVDNVDPPYDISEGGHADITLLVGSHHISGTYGGYHLVGGTFVGPFPVSVDVSLVEAGTTWSPY